MVNDPSDWIPFIIFSLVNLKLDAKFAWHQLDCMACICGVVSLLAKHRFYLCFIIKKRTESKALVQGIS